MVGLSSTTMATSSQRSTPAGTGVSRCRSPQSSQRSPVRPRLSLYGKRRDGVAGAGHAGPPALTGWPGRPGHGQGRHPRRGHPPLRADARWSRGRGGWARPPGSPPRDPAPPAAPVFGRRCGSPVRACPCSPRAAGQAGTLPATAHRPPPPPLGVSPELKHLEERTQGRAVRAEPLLGHCPPPVTRRTDCQAAASVPPDLRPGLVRGAPSGCGE